MIEEWKFYKETNSNAYGHRVYEVSNLGRVKCNGEIVPPAKSGQYYTVARCLLHRVVAELFIPNPDSKPYIDHINGNTHDNRVSNLHWVTQKENMNNPICRNKMSESHKGKEPGNKGKKGPPSPMKGKKLSEEHKRKISEAHMGKPSNFKGKPRSEETKQKMSATLKGKIPWNKGKKLSEEHKQNLREAWVRRKKRES